MANPLAVGGFTQSTPSYSGYAGGGYLNMDGLRDRMNQSSLAGGYLDKERVKGFTDVFGSEIGPLAALLDMQREREGSPARLQEQLDVLGPWYKDIAATSQKYGLQSNLIGAGLGALQSIPETINSFRAIPLQGMYQQTQTIPSTFAAYGSGRPGFSSIRSRLGAR